MNLFCRFSYGGTCLFFRLLIFSKGPIEGVSVEVDGVSVGRVKHVGGPLYVVPWQPMLYAQGLHVIRVSAEVLYFLTFAEVMTFGLCGCCVCYHKIWFCCLRNTK